MDKLFEFDRDKTLKFYDYISQTSKDWHRQLGWNSEKNQIIRFQKLLDVGVMNGETILDFGCGYGDLYDYTLKKDLKVKYIGIDINRNFIYRAVEIHKEFKDCKFYITSDIKKVPDKYDWFLASGSFTMTFTFDEIMKVLLHAYGKSTRGVVFNLLKDNHLNSYISSDNYYGGYLYNTNWVVSQLEKQFPNVEKTEDYLPNDCTYYLKK